MAESPGHLREWIAGTLTLVIVWCGAVQASTFVFLVVAVLTSMAVGTVFGKHGQGAALAGWWSAIAYSLAVSYTGRFAGLFYALGGRKAVSEVLRATFWPGPPGRAFHLIVLGIVVVATTVPYWTTRLAVNHGHQ